jgi:hypothetical protein
VKVQPLGAVRQRPYAAPGAALLFPGPGRRLLAFTRDGDMYRAYKTSEVERLLDRLAPLTCYVTGGLAELKRTTDARAWTMETWRDRYVSMYHPGSGLRVRSLRGTLAKAPGGPLGAAEALWAVLRWLDSYGVRAKSIGSMGWDLWRASLRRSIRLGFDRDTGRAALFGGRQECHRPGRYEHQALYDLSAAYPSAQAARPFALYLRPVSASTRLDPDTSGLARARITIPSIDPERPYGPLPYRLRSGTVSYPTSGEPIGIWAWCELAAAADLGYRVEVSECWAPTREVDLFSSWWEDIAVKGRNLGDGASGLAKAICNSVWGRFAMHGTAGTIRWADERGEVPIYRAGAPRNRPEDYAAHIAAETTARVRTKILHDALYPGGHPSSIQHLDTDGFIARRGLAVGDGRRGPGHWRVKTTMRRVEIRAPQIYRYECGRVCCLAATNPGHYIAAGIPNDAAADYFRRSRRTLVSAADVVTGEHTVPPTDPNDVEAIERWLEETKAMVR